MNSKPALSEELRNLIETRMEHTLKAIEDTLQQILRKHEVNPINLKETIQSLERSFSLLSQKWNMEILYILFLRNSRGFNDIKKILGVNSRTLSDKLKVLTEAGYIERSIGQEPPLRVAYSLTTRGKNTVLLALPLLYYSA